MSNIRYINDVEFKYNDDIINGLKSYNKLQTGYREKDKRDFYVFEDSTLIAACHTKQALDWCKISGIYYKDLDVLKALMNDVRKYYRGNVEGIQFDTVLQQRTVDFLKIGFTIAGELNDMPSENKNYFLVDRDLKRVEIEEDYQLKSSSEPNVAYDSVLKSEIKNYKKSLDFSTDKIDIQFVAFDKDKFIGGIYGHFQYEYLFINVLFVNKKYRGRRIASKLMHKIESEAVKQGVTNIYLTTFEFQARDFYKKRGYEVVMKIEDFPIGFKEYTLYKDMKLLRDKTVVSAKIIQKSPTTKNLEIWNIAYDIIGITH